MKTAHRWMVACLVAGVGLVATMGCGTGDKDTIVRVSRQNNSGTYVYFREAVLGKEREFKQGSVDQSGSKDVVELVSTTPSAIGYSGMGFSTDAVKMLKVSKKKGDTPVEPNVENAKDGSYPISRPLFIYTLGEPTGELKQYLAWMFSPEGQQAVLDTGYVPIAPTEGEPLKLTQATEAVEIKVKGSDTMVNLAASWAGKYNRKNSKVNVSVKGGGSGTGIKALIDGTTDIANCSRKMKPAEKEKAEANSGKVVKEYVVGKDALAIYVHKDNPLDVISLEELAEIYGDGGTITTWSQLTGQQKAGE